MTSERRSHCAHARGARTHEGAPPRWRRGGGEVAASNEVRAYFVARLRASCAALIVENQASKRAIKRTTNRNRKLAADRHRLGRERLIDTRSCESKTTSKLGRRPWRPSTTSVATIANSERAGARERSRATGAVVLYNALGALLPRLRAFALFFLHVARCSACKQRRKQWRDRSKDRALVCSSAQTTTSKNANKRRRVLSACEREIGQHHFTKNTQTNRNEAAAIGVKSKNRQPPPRREIP